MTDIVPASQSTDIAAQMQWAQAVTTQPERGGQSLLPEAYRNNPANVLIATGLGAAMGLSFAESLYRISVIKGKPSAAAELIAANVRKAGHKLRIQVSENPPSATCTIIRADDPDYPTVITRDMAWAASMGLTSEPNYKKQPSTMLSYRAITACARLACPEALYGVTYTPDEATSIDGPEAPAPAVKRAGLAGLRDAVQPSRPDPAPATFSESPEGDTADVEDAVEVDETGEAPSDAAVRAMFAAFGEAGFTGDARSAEGRQVRLDYIGQVIGREVASSKDLTAQDVSRVIDALKTDTEGERAMTTLYVAGPMTGLPEFNFPAFEKAATDLTAAGYEVLSPHWIDATEGTTPGEQSWQWYMRRALTLMLRCDGVALLPRWRDSRGARIEVDLADDLGMPWQGVQSWLYFAPKGRAS